jgi:formylglycine-generating enzyme required for sulfatase activity
MDAAVRKPLMLLIFIILSPRQYALDREYAPIVNAAIADLKSRTKLSLLRGHVAINVSSGNKELDARLGEALQSAYPNFVSKTDAVNREDLYQMMVKAYRENSGVIVRITVTDFKGDAVVDRTVAVKKVPPSVVETLQYKTAAIAKNEFETYLNSAFSGVGGVARETQVERGPPGFVFIQGGTFTMGSPPSEPDGQDDEVQHSVTVSSFYMGKYEVTQKEWRKVMGNNPSYFNIKGEDLPVESVSWNDAVKYCNKRSEMEGLNPAYTIKGKDVIWNRKANGYRLPTEAEWEYACRAGTTTPFNTGNNITTDQANYAGNHPYNGNARGTSRRKTTPVGSFAPNLWGLYDMHGNVDEWCWDWYGKYSREVQTDPRGAVYGAYRVLRGGSWFGYAGYMRSAQRSFDHPRGRFSYVSYLSYIGFRVARNAE